MFEHKCWHSFIRCLNTNILSQLLLLIHNHENTNPQFGLPDPKRIYQLTNSNTNLKNRLDLANHTHAKSVITWKGLIFYMDYLHRLHFPTDCPQEIAHTSGKSAGRSLHTDKEDKIWRTTRQIFRRALHELCDSLTYIINFKIANKTDMSNKCQIIVSHIWVTFNKII